MARSLIESNYADIEAALAHHHFTRIPDRSGNPFYIVQKRNPDVCPPKAAETYYAWGFKFNADGALHHFWGNPPLPAVEVMKKITKSPRPS